MQAIRCLCLLRILIILLSLKLNIKINSITTDMLTPEFVYQELAEEMNSEGFPFLGICGVLC